MEPQGVIKPRIVARLAEVDAEAWNALTGGVYPFLRHEFLSALEEQGCLSHRIGWVPQHLVVEDGAGRLVAACPMYLKFNSFGEFVFDWSWADAYQRSGLDYYPKLVVAAPFTPATGPRLLIAPEFRAGPLAERVMDAALAVAEAREVSSLHWLFTTDAPLLDSPRWLKRVGCQFHWENRDYGDFEAFLDELMSRKRKEIRRERRAVAEAGIELVRVRGSEAEPKLWRTVHELYCTTFAKYGNYPALTESFFRELAAKMGDQVLLVLARKHKEMIGVAYFLVGDDTLYGRYWGCIEEIPDLHFEACYYQGIEFCIEQKLRRFEPGAQGEHKISRGFLPTRTWSAHWIAHPEFQQPVARFLTRETIAMNDHIAELSERSPYKNR